ncbi:MAG: hypothetical protein WCW66_00830 [Patescibacteria group bacterium]|jgi:hypothetical protein
MKTFFESPTRESSDKKPTEQTAVESENPPEDILITRQVDEIAEKRIMDCIDADYVLKNIPFLLEYWGQKKAIEVIMSLARLVIELEDRITNYDTIISDDASGRIISLFLREVINRKKAELEEEPVQTFFIAGGQHHNAQINEAIQQFIAEKKLSIDKALLVTEHIQTGYSIGSLARILEKQDVDFDIASLSVDDPQDLGNLETLKNKKIIYGSTDFAGLSFYKRMFTGVEKTNQISAHPTKNSSPSTMEEVKKARQEMKFIAAEISRIILEKKD